MAALPVYVIDMYNAESLSDAFALVYDGDVAELAGAMWRATFRDPAEPRNVYADLRTDGECSILTSASTTPEGRGLLTFTFFAPPGKFKGVTGLISTELMRMDGVSAKDIAVLQLNLKPSNTVPIGDDP